MTNKSSMRRKLLCMTLSLSLLVPVLAACSKDAGEEAGQERVLRIGLLYGNSSDDSAYRQMYTDAFELTHPNVRVEFVSAIDSSQYRYSQPDQNQQIDPVELTKKLMTGANPPDVMIMDTGTYKQLVQENMLKQLDPLMQQDKFDTSEIVPTVLEGIKQLGDNNIYGLAPTFSASALFYNKKFFTDKNIELPKDNMTWDELFALAQRLKSGDGKQYGFTFNRWSGDPFYDMTGTYLGALQLRMWDSKGEKMTVNTPAWEKAWSTFAKLINDKVIPGTQDPNQMQQYDSKVYNPIQGDKFLSGQTAMTIGEYNYVNEIIDANKNASKIPNYEAVDWDVVTIPTFPETAGIGGNIYLNNLMSINAKAQNDKDAWEFIKFLNGDQWAKLKSRSGYEMVARKKYIQPKEGLNYNIAAFYTLKPVPPSNNDLNDLYRTKPNIWQVQDKGREIFLTVLAGKKSSADGLKEWEEKGNELLVQIAKTPASTPEASPLKTTTTETTTEASAG